MQKKSFNRAVQAVILPLADQWVLATARRDGGRPVLENLSTFARDDNDIPALKKIAAQFDVRNAELATMLVGGEYQLLQTDAPDIADREELREALRWKVKDMVDFPVDQARLDYFDVQQDGGPAVRGRQVFVVIAKAATLRPKVEMFQDARLALSVIDIPEMGLRNVAQLFEQASRGLVLLNFTALGGMLLFSFSGEICAVRRIEVTLPQLETAESRLSELFDRIALEVQRSIDNFERQFKSITLARLVTPDLASVPGLIDYLRGYLSIKVDPLDLAEVIDFPAIPELRNPRRQAELMPIIGAALRASAD